MNKIILFLIFGCFVSCKKTKLEGELSVLVGKWKWTHTLIIDDPCNNHVVPSVLHTPMSVGYEYEIEFIKEGKFKIRKSGEKEKTERLIRHINYRPNPPDTAFAFSLNRKKNPGFTVIYHKSSGKEYLYSKTLPLDLNNSESCIVIRSVFEKVK